MPIESPIHELSTDSNSRFLGPETVTLSVWGWKEFWMHRPTTGSIDRCVQINKLARLGFIRFSPCTSTKSIRLGSPAQELFKDSQTISLGPRNEKFSLWEWKVLRVRWPISPPIDLSQLADRWLCSSNSVAWFLSFFPPRPYKFFMPEQPNPRPVQEHSNHFSRRRIRRVLALRVEGVSSALIGLQADRSPPIIGAGAAELPRWVSHLPSCTSTKSYARKDLRRSSPGTPKPSEDSGKKICECSFFGADPWHSLPHTASGHSPALSFRFRQPGSTAL